MAARKTASRRAGGGWNYELTPERFDPRAERPGSRHHRRQRIDRRPTLAFRHSRRHRVVERSGLLVEREALTAKHRNARGDRYELLVEILLPQLYDLLGAGDIDATDEDPQRRRF
jgi:hypothetical protein